MRLSPKAWNDAIGEAAQKIGEAGYELVLLELFGQVVAHDATIVARYSTNAPVDVVFFKGLPPPIVDLFRREYYQTDPGPPTLIRPLVQTPDIAGSPPVHYRPRPFPPVAPKAWST
jgi:hypothetical protein